MAERFHGDPLDNLTGDELIRLTALADRIENNNGPLATEGIDKTGKDISGLDISEGARQHVEQAESIMRIARYSPRLFRRRGIDDAQNIDTISTSTTPSITFKRAAQITGVTLLSGVGAATVIEALGVVLLGATLPQTLPAMIIFGLLVGGWSGNEARKATKLK